MIVFDRGFLLDVRRRAIRRGVWFSCMDESDRGVFYLVTRVVERVESVILGKVLLKILRKLRDAMKSEFTRHWESFGVEAVRRVAEQARGFGSRCAGSWVSLGFARYLTLMDLNKPPGWGIH